LRNTIWQNGLPIVITQGVIAQNALVYMAGIVSGVQPGIIQSTNATSTVTNDATLTGVRATYTRAGGDSGGPVYRQQGNTEARLVGIHARGNATTGFFVRSLATLQSYGLGVW